MRRLLVGLCLCVGFFFAGCARETAATSDDLQRFALHGDDELARIHKDIERFVVSNGLSAQALPLDTARFMEWRRREWWALKFELALLRKNAWADIEKMTKEVGRFYGYNITNFPRATDDVLNFFHRADVEWSQLVMDVAIFQEYRNRELWPLRQDIKEFYAKARWEVATLNNDVTCFLRWREREYEKLIQDGRDFFAYADWEMQQMAFDVQRFWMHANIEGARMTADLSAFYTYEKVSVPRLVDDVWRFTRWREREMAKFKADLQGWRRNALDDNQALIADLRRYGNTQRDDLPKMMAEVDRFFAWYEREFEPLSDEVKRFWKTNIALQRLAKQDLYSFYRHTFEEVAELRAGAHRFFAYGSKEWDDLVVSIKRFTTDHDPVFGDGAMPSGGRGSPVVFDDHMPPDSGYGHGTLITR